MTLTQEVGTTPETPEEGTVPEGLSVDVRQRVSALARTSRLLVACDYDGALAPFDPADDAGDQERSEERRVGKEC